jgi:DNA (cytosine-5)-methyltransferase 1
VTHTVESPLRDSLLAKYAPPRVRPNTEYHPAPGVGDGDLGAIEGVDWGSFRMIDLFAGIGGIRIPFEEAGARCVFSSEWDAQAQITYKANFGEQPHGDITEIEPESIPEHDLLVGGFPCQPFSIIGARKGFADTRGTLFFNIEQILAAKRPAAILLENVRQFRSHDGGRTFTTVIQRLNDLGYFTHTAILNALHYGVPQLRNRTFIVGFRADLAFRYPEPHKELVSLDGIFENDADVDASLWATERIRKKRLERIKEQGTEPFYPSMWHENKGGHIGVHPFSCALRRNASHNYLLVNGLRRPSPRECLRLLGFPDSYKIVVPGRAIRAQAGNSVAVPVIRAIAGEMLSSLQAMRLRDADGTSRRSLFEMQARR